MEQEQGEAYMVDIKKDMIKFSTNKELSKNEYRNWSNFVQQHNHENPTDQIAYEVSWKDDIYSVTLLDLKVDKEVKA
jgi:hypothetical protein